MSFSAVLQQVKTTLESDATLKAFAASKWKKSLNVKITWRNREAIAPSDLPLIMLTRPRVGRSRDQYRKITSASVIRIYAGFYQPTEDRRQFELIEFEEQILDALERSTELRDLVNNMSPADGANDEGALGDHCFTVQEIEIKTRG